MTAGGDQAKPKPAGAWTAEQTVEYMIDKVFEEGDFYVICPDNETSSVSWAGPRLDGAKIRVVGRVNSLCGLAEPAHRRSTRRGSSGTSGISSRTDPLSRAGIRLVSACTPFRVVHSVP
jgi:hypothetical protein